MVVNVIRNYNGKQKAHSAPFQAVELDCTTTLYSSDVPSNPLKHLRQIVHENNKNKRGKQSGEERKADIVESDNEGKEDAQRVCTRKTGQRGHKTHPEEDTSVIVNLHQCRYRLDSERWNANILPNNVRWSGCGGNE